MPRRALRQQSVPPPTIPSAVCIEDRRVFHRKAGYLGHVPRFAGCRSGLGGNDSSPDRKGPRPLSAHARIGTPGTRSFFRQFYPFASEPLRTDPSGSMTHEQLASGQSVVQSKKMATWTMSEVPRETQEHPHSPPRRPVPSRHIVGFSGHRAGAQFITGETFAQEEVMRCPCGSPLASGRGYEPNKGFAKGRNDTFSGGMQPNRPVDGWASLAPRLPGSGGGPALLRASRRPQSAPSAREPAPRESLPQALTQRGSLVCRRHPVYPIQRGPTRVRAGGHEVFLVN
eukprot:TRINITY_DN5837_c0_g1_i1.p1 TRINITY_DN5837_c0_g1~~TRINITY_DN5837_c0_g1_i1.p1  ORF type:complete len:285 (+),score=14.22 TRINITY_DN5837_c0_g1_i1:58-912(+)